MALITRVALLLASAAALAGIGAVTARLAGGEGRVDAVLVHGPLVSMPVVIEQAKLATALHDEVQHAQRYLPRYPRELLTRRPCLTMSAFFPAERTDRAAAARRRPDRADASWSYYPAVEHEPAVLGNARISDAHLSALARRGLPVRVERGASAPCQPATATAVTNAD